VAAVAAVAEPGLQVWKKAELEVLVVLVEV
jgi:hypothetical protein